MAKTLIIRLSAIGDVAMTIPIIYSVARAHPEDAFTVLTQPFLTTLFIHRGRYEGCGALAVGRCAIGPSADA